jgi:hypothetical protein
MQEEDEDSQAAESSPANFNPWLTMTILALLHWVRIICHARQDVEGWEEPARLPTGPARPQNHLSRIVILDGCIYGVDLDTAG